MQWLIQKVEVMCSALKHGGPDDGGIYADEKSGLVFGHRRLSILDLSSNGHQPMADSVGKVWITFNGEIYNYLELKKELLSNGFKFNSNTDTEVIITAYLFWGIPGFSKLRGMFAFALFDAAKSVTYLVRDTAGIKPLYYHAQNKGLSFASEVKAFRIAGITNETDESWKVRFLAFGHIPEPDTTLKNVRSLPKGSFLTWYHHESVYSIKPFTEKTSAGNYLTNINTIEARLRHSLAAAVKRQLIADAPIGVFLSGGIDSGLLALLAGQQKEQGLKTISIYFNEKQYDERKFQELLSNKITGEKFTHLVKQKDFDFFFPQIITDMDMPATDGINTWFISKHASEDGLKAVLSGLGADELFGGYPSFNRIRYLKYLRKIPSGLFKAAQYFNTDSYRKISFLTNNHPLADYLVLRGLFIPEDIAQLLDADLGEVNEILFNSYPVAAFGHYDQEHAAWLETNLYMQNQLLRDTDVMGMSHGLEVRVPFLDEDFCCFAESISPEIRFNKTHPKKILTDSFKNLLPDEIWKRPKMGFTFPLQEWMRNHAEISNENNYKGKLAKLSIKKFKTGQLHWSKAFALYQVQ